MPNARYIATLLAAIGLGLLHLAKPAAAQPAPDSLEAGAATPDTLNIGVPPLELQPGLTDAAILELRLAVEGLRADVADLRADVAETVRSDSASEIEDGGQIRQARDTLSGIVIDSVESVILILIFFYTIRGLSWLLERLAERNATRRLLYKRLVPISRILLWSIAVYMILAVAFDISGEQFIAAGAAVGVAVGFAAQDILKNIFGGLIIIFDRPFQVGDKIRVGGTYGEVVSIGLRATRIETPDDNLVSVPNAQVLDGQVSNANAGNLDCQVVTSLYLPGWVDVMKAKRIAYDAAANSQYVFLEKPIVVIIKDDFRETFLTQVDVKAYVIDTRYEQRLVSDITETAKSAFLREGMLYPMPGFDTINQTHLESVNEDDRETES